jgi:hypothetical protein
MEVSVEKTELFDKGVLCSKISVMWQLGQPFLLLMLEIYRLFCFRC